MRTGNWKKIFKISILIFTIFIVILILAASPLTRYMIEKYDVQFTGREIEIDRAFVNPLTGNLSLKNFRLYEQNSDSIFIKLDNLKANFAIVKLFSKVYEISSLHFEEPEIEILKSDSIFNFDDLIEKFAVEEVDTLEKLHLNILNISVKDGRINYKDLKTPQNYYVSEINFNSPGMRWNSDTIQGNFSFIPVEGLASGDFVLNMEKLDFQLNMNLKNLKSVLFEKFLQAYTDKASINGNINMDMEARGNFNFPSEANLKGRLELNDFHFGRNPEKDYVSAERLIISINEIDLKEKKYFFDTILIHKPYILFELYDSLDNFSHLFPESAQDTVIEIDTVNVNIDFNRFDYSINNLAIQEGIIEFNDFSVTEKFSIAFNPFNIKADSINKSNKRVTIDFSSKIKPYGSFSASLTMDPKNEKNFDFFYKFQKIPASLFNPYIVTNTSYQLDRGTVEMNGDWHVRDNNIRSNNHFLVLDPRDTKRVRGKDKKWIPLPLIMSFVRERGSVIDYKVPISGDLKDPNFHLKDAIIDLLKNILVKPPTTPYGLQVRNIEQEIEKTLTVKWKMRQVRIDDDQKKFLKEIANFLGDNPEAIITARPIFHEEKEKESILFFEGKKKYIMITGNKSSISDKDSLKIEKMGNKDSLFVQYLNKAFRRPELYTIQEKYYQFVGKEVVDAKYKQLADDRKNAFSKYFRDEKIEKQIEVLDVRNEVPFNWFSYYDLNYKGDMPESLSKAFEKLYDVNTEGPRKEYFNLRRRK